MGTRILVRVPRDDVQENVLAPRPVQWLSRRLPRPFANNPVCSLPEEMQELARFTCRRDILGDEVASNASVMKGERKYFRIVAFWEGGRMLRCSCKSSCIMYIQQDLFSAPGLDAQMQRVLRTRIQRLQVAFQTSHDCLASLEACNGERRLSQLRQRLCRARGPPAATQYQAWFGTRSAMSLVFEPRLFSICIRTPTWPGSAAVPPVFEPLFFSICI